MNFIKAEIIQGLFQTEEEKLSMKIAAAAAKRKRDEMYERRNNVTSDDYATEGDVTKAVEAFFAFHRCFELKTQVLGTSDITPARPYKEQHKNFRIDGVLIPTQWLLARGWPFGCIGLELKKSNVKLGRPIAQSIDYMNSSWNLSDDQSKQLSYVAIVPWHGPTSGPMLSLASQLRIIGGRLDGDNFCLYPLGGKGCGAQSSTVTITPTDVEWTDGETGRKNGSR